MEPLQTEHIDKFEATIFLARSRAKRRDIGLVVMDRHKCALRTSIAELCSPSVTLDIIGHYHSPLCHKPQYRCPLGDKPNGHSSTEQFPIGHYT